MSDLDSVESRGNQRLETIPASAVGGVRPDGEGARLVRDRDRVFDRKLVLWDESAPVVPEIRHERVAEIVHHAAGNERARNVGATDCSTVCLCQHFVERNRYPQCVQLFDYLRGAREAHQAQLRQSLLQGVEFRQMERQQMYFVVLVERAELYSGNYANSQTLPGLAGNGHSRDRIVVSEGERLEATALGGLDYLFWWENAVRGGRMGMQVDERRPARLCAHFA